MSFGNFWRGGGRERFGSERDQERNRDRWRTQGNDWRDEERNRWRDNEQSENRYGGSDWQSGENYGDRSRGYAGGGYGGGRQGYGGERYRSQREDYGREGYGSGSGRGWGSEERESDYAGARSGGSEYDYRGGSLYGGGFSRGYGSSGYGSGGGSYETFWADIRSHDYVVITGHARVNGDFG